MKVIKNKIKNNRKLYKLFQALNLVKSSLIYSETGLKKRYPKVIQFPITNICNSNCIMCNIPNMHSKKESELSINEWNELLNDKLFKEIEAVGINGGEPFLKTDLIEIIDVILKLPNLKSLNIISNGFNTNLILKQLKQIYEKCKQKKIMFSVSFSLDGYQEIHDNVRGIEGVFKRTLETIESIKSNKQDYCDFFDVGCTVVKQNIFHINELKKYCEIKNIPIKFRLGIKNKRIESEKKYESFSVLEDSFFKQTATEIFYTLYSQQNNLFDKYKYWAIYDFLANNKKRALGCMWKEKGVTLNGEGKIFYCAVESKVLEKENETCLDKIFFDSMNLEYRNSIIENYCNNCIHDYSGKPLFQDVIRFFKYYLKEDREWGNVYKKELKK